LSYFDTFNLYNNYRESFFSNTNFQDKSQTKIDDAFIANNSFVYIEKDIASLFNYKYI